MKGTSNKQLTVIKYLLVVAVVLSIANLAGIFWVRDLANGALMRAHANSGDINQLKDCVKDKAAFCDDVGTYRGL